ncbi:hypothetical protein K5I29_02375 [Flavobacterium agricola]|uniref:DNA-binding protein HU-beta n=1 Tax=Flavobacterium agricola TaxID=2870839 RepID=A0ABY6LZP6_9FLAO|nr:hypothetical protein [Flavobacterium agricola]UYW01790.1 hypothetical protein K5I29_02375 [Flavobacterium agricola]
MADSKTNTEKGAVNDATVTTTVEEVLKEKGAESLKNIRNGKELEKVSLTDKVKIVFTKDYGFMKKDQEATVSALAFEVYSKAGVAKKK